MQKGWLQCTLQDVESFKKALIHKFFLQEYDILFQNAEKGCICVTWLTSTSIATLLKQNLANIETEFFTNHGIDTVTIDGQDVSFTSDRGTHATESWTEVNISSLSLVSNQIVTMPEPGVVNVQESK